ncbi:MULTISPECIES: glucosaminidase domain-containing protein [Bacillaceae]|uniref:glucosaminidase domain-containing protein n=1 Tax=Bacillaceae TaxID=186817 RepID=UPI001F5F5EC7|nr:MULTISPECIES: glucosaminidase domain-containing protein [Bacillaceae]
MNIGNDWITKAMVMNTLSGNQKLPTQLGASGSDFSDIFASVLTNLINQSESRTPIQPNLPVDFFGMNTGNLTFDTIVPDMKEISSSSTASLRFQPTSADKMNQVLDGKLKGMGDVFVRAGQLFNVDSTLLSAIAIHETGNGKSSAANVKNNIAGMMGVNGLKSYASVEDSIMDMARNIGKNYLGKGLSNIAEIGAKYAPVGAGNDPTGLNNHWVKGVTKFFNILKA